MSTTKIGRFELMSQDESDRLEATEGMTYVAWEHFGRFTTWWRDRHPDDDRDDLELTAEFAKVEWTDEPIERR